MGLLKHLCVTRGLAAAVVIHQPDGYVFEFFDSLVLNSRGKCIFSDNVSRLEDLYQDRYGCAVPTSIHELPVDLLRRLKTLPDDVVSSKPSNLSIGIGNNSVEDAKVEPSSFIPTEDAVSFFRKLV